MKIFLTIFFTILFFTKSATLYAAGCSKDYSFLVLGSESGQILLEDKGEKILYPASLVKLMTLYLTFEALSKHKISLDKVIEVSARGEEISKINKINSLHLKEGDKITVRQAINAVIVKSYNEAAVSLAEVVSGSEWEFVRKMNEKARQLGMNNSSFRNASGLHEEGQYTTSYDLARLTIALQKDFPLYYHFFSQKKFKFNGIETETHNHVLLKYKGAEGMKTGFTNASGFNLVSSAKKDKNRIISILLGCATSQKRDQLTEELLDEGFKKISDNNKIEVKLSKVFNYSASQTRNDTYEEQMRFGSKIGD